MTNTLIILVVMNIVIGLVVFIMGLFLIRQIYLLYKRQRIALFIGEDKLPMNFQKISPKDKTFLDSDKNRYNTGIPQVKFGNKEFLIYRYNHADPIDLFGNDNSLLQGDVYQAIFENEVAKALNRINPLGNLNMKKILLYGVVAIIAFLVIKSMFGG